MDPLPRRRRRSRRGLRRASPLPLPRTRARARRSGHHGRRRGVVGAQAGARWAVWGPSGWTFYSFVWSGRALHAARQRSYRLISSVQRSIASSPPDRECLMLLMTQRWSSADQGTAAEIVSSHHGHAEERVVVIV